MKGVAEAPSKAIITGEHFVVHGAWALAAALPRRVRVEVEPSPRFRVSSDKFSGSSPALRPIGRVIDAMGKEFSIKPRVKVSVASAVPEGAGLGSSAATMVAAASAFSRLHGLGLGVNEIVKFAMVGERDVHGNPSGIDPNICAHGGVLMFRTGHQPRRVHLKWPSSLIVAYSGRQRSTKGQIGKVALTKEERPDLFNMLTDSIGWLSESAADMLVQGDGPGLGRLLTLNHVVLRSMGVSNDTLDEMVDALCSLGCHGAKLTGAGGGGSVVAVAPEAKEKSIVSGLTARGFETFRARIPAEGVKSWLER
ncbi:MAG: mevalonate kinase [Nitrososphaerota archaeon]|nr:mevalonate kinase [Nitrososphaerota archaeon]